MQKQVMTGILLFALCLSFASTADAANQLFKKLKTEVAGLAADAAKTSSDTLTRENKTMLAGGSLLVFLGKGSEQGMVARQGLPSVHQCCTASGRPTQAIGASSITAESAIAGPTIFDEFQKQRLKRRRDSETIAYRQIREGG